LPFGLVAKFYFVKKILNGVMQSHELNLVPNCNCIIDQCLYRQDGHCRLFNSLFTSNIYETFLWNFFSNGSGRRTKCLPFCASDINWRTNRQTNENWKS